MENMVFEIGGKSKSCKLISHQENSLQKPRTHHPNEMIFIMYHQLTELVLKMMIHEAAQICESEPPDAARMTEKTGRLNRYTHLLITSFDITREGMDFESFNQFRKALASASGFPSAQFRELELYCTPLENLLNETGQKMHAEKEIDLATAFDHLYWKDAGYNRESSRKTLTLTQFEKRYQEDLMRLSQKLRGRTLEEQCQKLEEIPDPLREVLRRFDQLYNIDWPLVHLRTARHYLQGKNATGGSPWEKYLHPQYQQRRFFPSLWSADELTH